MTSYSTLIAAAAALAVSLAATPSMALTAQECSAKYNAAKAAGTLNGMKWNDFRKAQCGDDAVPAAAATGDAATAAATTTGAGGAVFPKVVDPKYAKEKPGKARMHTCRDQYKVNKAANANGGMKWIQKGGGYYSACNKVLKAI